ncbi:MAG TPA: FAD-dependent oxidoreductase [Dehalococcoidia bacterium]|nr:FAD-dependent oxidoreductase [Dehalococcoidia bacterium]
MTSTPDVVVVGAGAVDAACAWYLTEAGLSVTLIEQEGVGSGASTHATGFLSLLATDFQTEPHLRLGVESSRLTRELVPRIEELTGIDVLYQRRPSLRLALEEAEEDLIRSSLEWQVRQVPAKWIDGEDVRAVEPRLSRRVRGAAFEAESAQLDSGRFTLALVTAAERRGADLLIRRANGLLREGDRVVGVRVPGGEVSAGAVVLAPGPWAAATSEWLGVPVPIRPLKGERLMLRLDEPPLAALISSPKRGHLISRRDGFLSAGSTAGRDFDDPHQYLARQSGEFDLETTQAALEELIERATDVFPAVENAEVVQQLAGVRPLSPDRRPLIGAVPGVPGAYLATGHGTKGIHLAAVTGRLIADLIADGRTDLPAALQPFDPGRFRDGAPADESTPRVTDD